MLRRRFDLYRRLLVAALAASIALTPLAIAGGGEPREVEGGVFPESNDGSGPEGTEQPDTPMPFADLLSAGETRFTDAGGTFLRCIEGEVTTALAGRYLHMDDACGEISESTAGPILDLGTSPGTDCEVPPGASPGNTHASRSGFYELNRIKEQARGQLPTNPWLEERLTARMNIESSCGAFWDGTTVGFFRSGASCANTGELAAVYDHEWGHGMDDNDAVPSISNPSEGIADLYAYLRLATSCIGRGFLPGNDCSGYGDPCTECTGVRDIDWARRASGEPHDLDWIDANCTGSGGPCGGTPFCEGAVVAEAVFDLVHRDLPDLFGMDFNTAHEVATRLTYLGGGAVGDWFTCAPPFGGCNAGSGYLQFLTADDDNGDLADGTPHMSAIFAAFDRHQIACDAPIVQDSGCAGAPTEAPVVVATATDHGASLAWSAVEGAASYRVYRTDGVQGCDFGKTLAGETAGTDFVDAGLKNGREVHYVVIPIGPGDPCFGPASSCTTVIPATGPNLAIAPVPASLTILSGDGDAFLDNCEQLSIGVEVSNVGAGTQTDVRIVGVEAIGHPGFTVLTPLPLVVDGEMAACEVGVGAITVEAAGLSPDDPVALRVEVTSDQLAPETRSQIVRIDLPTEGDFQHFAARTFSYETDLEGWGVVQGTFDRTGGGGGDGTDFSLDSSAFLDDQCDEVRSPVLALSSTSTLTLWNNYDVEPQTSGSWYDRANVAIVEADGSRTVIAPDGGRLYNADSSGAGNYTGCNEPEEGWAGTMNAWGTSSWSAAALDALGLAGQLLRLSVVYGTDAAVAERGFWFDQVTVTEVDLRVADGQSDVCASAEPIFVDGFETGDTSRWSVSVP